MSSGWIVIGPSMPQLLPTKSGGCVDRLAADEGKNRIKRRDFGASAHLGAARTRSACRNRKYFSTKLATGERLTAPGGPHFPGRLRPRPRDIVLAWQCGQVNDGKEFGGPLSMTRPVRSA